MGIAKKDHEYKTDSAAIPIGITVLLYAIIFRPLFSSIGRRAAR